VRIFAPENQLADGIGEAALGYSKAFIDELLGSLVIGGKEDLKWCVFLDLRVKLAGRAEADQRRNRGAR